MRTALLVVAGGLLMGCSGTVPVQPVRPMALADSDHEPCPSPEEMYAYIGGLIPDFLFASGPAPMTAAWLACHEHALCVVWTYLQSVGADPEEAKRIYLAQIRLCN